MSSNKQEETVTVLRGDQHYHAVSESSSDPQYNGSVVVWSTDGMVGHWKYPGGSRTVYHPTHALRRAVYQALSLLTAKPALLRSVLEAKNPENVDVCKEVRVGSLTRSYFGPLGNTWPEIDLQKQYMIANGIVKTLATKIPALLEECKQTKQPTNDGEFLWSIAAKRDWKSGCAVCFTDKIMGTACSCGHTEIMVLRPCGHAFCTRPCWVEFVKTSGGPAPKQQTMMAGDKMFMVVGGIDCSSDTSKGDPSYTCPLCRTQSTSVFAAENVAISGIFDKYVDDVADTVADRFGIIDDPLPELIESAAAST